MTRVPEPADTLEPGDGRDVQRIFAYVGSIGLLGSYALTWARVTDPEMVDAGTTTLRGDALSTLPEVVAALGFVTLALTALRWRGWSQALVGLGGLAAVTIGLLGRAWLASSAGALDLGSQQGPAAVFEPSLALVVTMGAGVLLIAGGFGAVFERILDGSAEE